jgi:hypothetical protein
LYKCSDIWAKKMLLVEGDSCTSTYAMAIDLLIEDGSLPGFNKNAFAVFASESVNIKG